MVDNPKGGRPLPKPKDDVEHVVEADILFSAIGQTSDIEFIPESMQKEMNLKRGRIKVDDNQYTDYKNFFADGYITPGEGDAITAIADGLRAVHGIIDRLE